MSYVPVMPPPTRRDVLWLIFWGTLSSAWCVAAALTLGATYDETIYYRVGLEAWHTRSHKPFLDLGTMPLPGELQYFPVYVSEVSEGRLAWPRFHELLPAARFASLPFWWLLLWSAGRLATCYGGPLAGRVAMAFLAVEPVLLGHACLAATDIPFAASLLTLLASFRCRRDERTAFLRLGPPAVWLAVTFLSKASALMFVPVCLLAVEAERLWRAGPRSPVRDVLRSVGDLGAVALGGGALIFLTCGKAHWAVYFQLRHNATGHGLVFLLGEDRAGGFWQYFPVALSAKHTLSLLAFVLLAGSLRPGAFLNGATCAGLGLLACTPLMKVQIGVRFVFAIAILLTVGAAAAFSAWHAAQSPGRRRTGVAVVAVLVAWSALASARVWPHGLSYTNEPYGGTANGDRVLSDSNFDWGQGLPELRAWAADHADAPLHLYYFGTDPAADAAPFVKREWAELATMESFREANRGSYVAVSTYLGRSGPMSGALRAVPLAGRTLTFRIYDLRQP
jgi:hypothetical protein